MIAFIPTEADIVRTFAVLDIGLGRCLCHKRPGIILDASAEPLCAECAAGCQYDIQGNLIPTTAEAIVADVVSGMPADELAILNDPSQTARHCRLCSCTELNACINANGDSCWWVSEDLCSHCVDGSGDPGEEAWKAVMDMHPDDVAVFRFAAVMQAKMKHAREVKGQREWDDPDTCSIEDLQQMLLHHVEKGDPVDIANFAMMIWNRQWAQAKAASPAPELLTPVQAAD